MAKLEATIVIPEGFSAEKKEGRLFLRKAGKEISRVMPLRGLKVIVSGSEIKLTVENSKERPLVGTYKSHIKNMIAGIEKPFEYKLKICSSHFPMSVKPKDGGLSVQNFFGGKNPINVKIPRGVDVNITGEIITVKSADIELAGQAASRIEKSTYLNKKDRRVFNDGIFITQKPK